MAHTIHSEELVQQREAWADLDAHRKRLADEWSEMKASIAKQEAALAARTAELTQREKSLRGEKSRIESDTKGLRQESAGLEARAAHARGIVEELERKRDDLRAEILSTVAKAEPEPIGKGYRVPLDRAADRDLAQWTAELDAQDRRITEEKAALAKLKTALDRESISLADGRKVLAEQFALLGAARANWQETEGRTVAEMEDLARALRQRDDEFVEREERLHKAEEHRRADESELAQFRTRLEAWQTKLVAVSRLWHAEREGREGEMDKRSKVLALREKIVKAAFERWDHVPEDDRNQLKLKLWSPDQPEEQAEEPSELDALREEFARAARELSEIGGIPDDHLPLADEEAEDEEPVTLQFAFAQAA